MTKCLGQNIITTLCGTNISKVEVARNDDDDDDDDDNDIDILDEAIEAPNDSGYRKPQPQHPNSTISHPLRSRIVRGS
jgi:hypothetical protein